MIQPASLWSLFKNCTDSEWLGKVCRALGGQDVDLDFGQRMMVAQIRQDSDWMDERIEENRERWKAKKQVSSQRKVENSKLLRENREEDFSPRKTENSKLPRENREVDFSPSLPSSLPTSLPPSLPTKTSIPKDIDVLERGAGENLLEDEHKQTHKMFEPPSIDDAREYCTQKGMPTNECENFIDYYSSNGWRVGKNKMVNWRSALSHWIRRSGDTTRFPDNRKHSELDTTRYFEPGYDERNGKPSF